MDLNVSQIIKKQDTKIQIVQMRIPTWMSDVTKMDRIKNEYTKKF